jgi:hypothetical protein
MSRFLLCAVVVLAAFGGALANPLPGAPAAAPAAPFVGRACNVKGVAGVCQTGGCAGQAVAGFCQGPSNVKCCVPAGTAPPAAVVHNAPAASATGAAAPAAPAAATAPAAPAAGPVIPNVGDHNGAVKPAPKPAAGGKVFMPNGKPAPQGTPAGGFPWTFPYSQARHIVSDFNLQRIRLYDGATMVKEWKMSSGKYGIGFKNDFAATPCGKFKVTMKVGNKQPLGMIIEKLTPQHRIGAQSDKFAHMQTRILVLDGVDKNAFYDNRNTRARSIYIHGQAHASTAASIARLLELAWCSLPLSLSHVVLSSASICVLLCRNQPGEGARYDAVSRLLPHG